MLQGRLQQHHFHHPISTHLSVPRVLASCVLLWSLWRGIGNLVAPNKVRSKYMVGVRHSHGQFKALVAALRSKPRGGYPTRKRSGGCQQLMTCAASTHGYCATNRLSSQVPPALTSTPTARLYQAPSPSFAANTTTAATAVAVPPHVAAM